MLTKTKYAIRYPQLQRKNETLIIYYTVEPQVFLPI